MISVGDNLDSAALEEYGVRGVSPQTFGGTLEAETPISLSRCRINGNVSIGMFTYIGPGSEISHASIGRYCAIAPKVTIGLDQHPTNWLSIHPFQFDGTRHFSRYPAYKAIANRRNYSGRTHEVSIGNDVWLGYEAVVMGGVTIGDGAVVGTRAVVTKDVEPYTIVAGVPARPIRDRFPKDLTSRLTELQWWNYDFKEFASSIDFRHAEDATATLESLVSNSSINRTTVSRISFRRADTNFVVLSVSGQTHPDEAPQPDPAPPHPE